MSHDSSRWGGTPFQLMRKRHTEQQDHSHAFSHKKTTSCMYFMNDITWLRSQESQIAEYIPPSLPHAQIIIWFMEMKCHLVTDVLFTTLYIHNMHSC